MVKQIILDENISKDACMELYKHLSPAEITKIRNTDFVGWMNENRKLLDGIYPEGHKIDDIYLTTEWLQHHQLW
jgi:hypothetical protein